MRCRACDTLMTDFEIKRKDSVGNYYDLCSRCFSVSSKLISDINATVDTLIELNDNYDDDIIMFVSNPEDYELDN